MPAPMSSFQRMPGRGTGFGRYWVNGDGPNGNPHTALNVQVHSDSEAAAPELYPAGLSSGVVRMDKHENEPEILVQLQEVLRSR